MPRFLGELAQSLERVADEDDGLHVANISRRIYKGKSRTTGWISGGHDFAAGVRCEVE
jgi:hypothetical protein